MLSALGSLPGSNGVSAASPFIEVGLAAANEGTEYPRHNSAWPQFSFRQGEKALPVQIWPTCGRQR